MEPEQLSIWSEEEINIFFPRKKTKKEILKEKLLERAVLSNDKVTKYNLSLNKKDLKDFFNKYNWEIGENYYMNRGVPQMLLTTLSQYSNKNQSELIISDLIIMYKSIQNAFSEEIDYNELRKFRKANKLTFFGGSQYLFMNRYVQEMS